MKAQRFSVIIPTLNEEKFLPNLLTSLVNQTEKPFEVIVVDGKSKDKTVAVAESFKKKLPLKVIVCERASLPMQRNRGAREARGDWLIFVDADSVLLPYCLERLEEHIGENPVQFVTTWGKPDSIKSQESIHTLLYNMFLESGLVFRRPLAPGPFTAVHRAAFAAVHGYDELLQFGEDQNFSQRLADSGISLSIFRETLYIWSLRRFRSHGFFRASWIYVQSGLRVLFTKKNYSFIPGYIMGGHVYKKKSNMLSRSVLKKYEKRLRILLRETFG